MEWWGIVALVVGIPIVLIPVALIWYINVSGIYTVIRETPRRRVARRKRVGEVRMAEEPVLK